MRIIYSVACLLALAATAAAQHVGEDHGDLEISIEAGSLYVEPGADGWLFEGEFPQPPDSFAYFGDEPGFEMEDGVGAAGDQFGFQLLSDLLFWNGGLADPIDQIEVSKGPASVVADAASGLLEGFLFGTADDEGGLHEHLEFALQTFDGTNYLPGGATGVYGLHLQLTSPQYGDSQPFLIALNNGLEEEQFKLGAEALAEFAGVPVSEPAACWLLVGAAASACVLPRKESR